MFLIFTLPEDSMSSPRHQIQCSFKIRFIFLFDLRKQSMVILRSIFPLFRLSNRFSSIPKIKKQPIPRKITQQILILDSILPLNHSFSFLSFFFSLVQFPNSIHSFISFVHSFNSFVLRRHFYWKHIGKSFNIVLYMRNTCPSWVSNYDVN